MPSLKTPAKINLFLNLKGQRADGFHEVCFVMQTVSLFDTSSLTLDPERAGMSFTCSQTGVTDNPDDNLVVKAYHAYFEAAERSPMSMAVHLEKVIPVQAGLGGGSSDAAAMLLLLNEVSGENLSLTALFLIAQELGSDVPFFLSGGTALATGRGEIVMPLACSLSSLPLVIIKPKNLGISTPKAYQLVREYGQYRTEAVQPFLEALPAIQSSRELSPFLLNDFERCLFPHYPLLGQMAEKMRALGIARPLLSGSGPSMVGFYEETTPEWRAAFSHSFPSDEYEVLWTKTLSTSVQAEPVF